MYEVLCLYLKWKDHSKKKEIITFKHLTVIQLKTPSIKSLHLKETQWSTNKGKEIRHHNKKLRIK